MKKKKPIAKNSNLFFFTNLIFPLDEILYIIGIRIIVVYFNDLFLNPSRFQKHPRNEIIGTDLE